MDVGCIKPFPSVVLGAFTAPVLMHVVMLALYVAIGVFSRRFNNPFAVVSQPGWSLQLLMSMQKVIMLRFPIDMSA